ncbi:hypothetical protein M422DRAFT_24988 [Sphaerobolus stellatus SS14]|nr:hypothetical protein M422DRAFT_24988 [Sphaerobolus stellatus SS14]
MLATANQRNTTPTLAKKHKSSTFRRIRHSIGSISKNLCSGKSAVATIPATKVPEQATRISIHTLTDEILTAIFLNIFPQLRYNPLESLDFLPTISLTTLKHPCLISNALMLVCKRWETIITKTPYFWSTIIINRVDDCGEDLIKRQLQRSGVHPLDIFVRHSKRSFTSAIPLKVLQLIRENLKRIRTFSGCYRPEEFETLFPPQQITEMPSLQIFNTIAPLPPTQESSQPVMGSILAPQLVFLAVAEVDHIFLFTIPEPQPQKQEYLKYLCIGSASVSTPCYTVLALLRRCPNLVRFIFHNTIAAFHREDSWATVKYLLPELVELSAVVHYTTDANFFFQSLDCPKLKRLRCAEAWGPDFLSEYTSRQVCWYFLMEYSETLEDIVLDPHLFASGINVIEPLVRRLENLTTLRIISVPIAVDFFEIFLPCEDGLYDRWSCPKLKTLILLRLDIESDSLIRVVKRRCTPDAGLLETGPDERQEDKDIKGRLQSVSVTACCFLTDSVYEEIIQLEKLYSKVFKFNPSEYLVAAKYYLPGQK